MVCKGYLALARSYQQDCLSLYSIARNIGACCYAINSAPRGTLWSFLVHFLRSSSNVWTSEIVSIKQSSKMINKILNAYDKLPWIIQSTIPIGSILSVIIKFHQIFNFNFMEFTGMTFSVVTSFYLIFHVCRFIYQNWIGIALGQNVDLTKVGKWAVVTGCTQGIGRAYVDALAKLGLNVVLMARSHEKLTEVAKEVQDAYHVDVKIIAVNFSGGREIYEEIERQLEGLEVGILINNVGMCTMAPERFLDLSKEFCQDMMNCNMLSMTMMTAIVLPGMLERKKGVVVNLGSISSTVNTPYLALYGATKAFMDKLTMDLYLEYKDQGIIFQSLIPGYVVTSMSGQKIPSTFVPTPEDFVNGALSRVGLQVRTAVCIAHQLLIWCITSGYYLRGDGSAYMCHRIARQFWFYGKKVMMHRSKKCS